MEEQLNDKNERVSRSGGARQSDSAAGLLRRLLDEASTLVRKEIALARVEISEALSEAKVAAISMASGGAVLFAGLLVLLAAAVLALAAEELHQVVQRVINRRGVRLAADVVLRLPHREVQRREDVHRARAGGRVPADLGIARSLVLAVVRRVDHELALGERARGDALEQREIRRRSRGGGEAHQVR